MNKYKITTLRQIQEIVTKENIDCFIADLHEFLMLNINIKKKLIEQGMKSDEVAKIQGEMTWIDDNKPGIKI